jgi:NADH dehydrogenase
MSVSLVSKRHPVVVVGGGAGGIELAIGLARRADATTDEVVLIDKESSHLWKPRLHEVAAGLMSPGEDRASYLGTKVVGGWSYSNTPWPASFYAQGSQPPPSARKTFA